MNVVMLTTTDNPFNPFDEYDKWYDFDVQMGYFTCQYLSRIVKTSDELSDAEEQQAIEDAIDEIVKLNILGIYKRVERETDQ